MEPLLVILDLDETLVHVPDHPLPRRSDFTVLGHAGYRRPHLDSFLEELRCHYRVAIWTAAEPDYADAVISAVIPWRAELSFVWTAEDCIPYGHEASRDRSTVKTVSNVRALGYDLDRVVAVDDSPEKHLRDYENLIPVAPFLGDHADDELPAAASFIHTLADVPNVRTVDKRFWRTKSKGRGDESR